MDLTLVLSVVTGFWVVEALGPLLADETLWLVEAELLLWAELVLEVTVGLALEVLGLWLEMLDEWEEVWVNEAVVLWLEEAVLLSVVECMVECVEL